MGLKRGEMGEEEGCCGFVTDQRANLFMSLSLAMGPLFVVILQPLISMPLSSFLNIVQANEVCQFPTLDEENRGNRFAGILSHLFSRARARSTL